MPSTDFFLTEANQKIFYRHWKPLSESKATVVFIHGLSEHSGRYEYQAEDLSKSGFNVYAFDNIGHGLSSGRRGFVNSFQDYLKILDQFVSFALKESGEKAAFLIGHSLGGLIAASYALQDGASGVKGVVLSSPALALSSGIKPCIFEELLIKALSIIWPTLELSNRLDPYLLSRDKTVVQNYIADSLIFRIITPRLFTEIQHAQNRLFEKARLFTMPCLMLSGKADKITQPESLLKFHGLIASKNKAIKLYECLYHEILNEPEKDSILADLKQWLLLQNFA